ncbi:SUN domain-containing protein 3 isoform X3 [Talpa occidentalis]|uniref:SUN domain-containing protein 3 isoform X3 n=1 Tax=Talpa occidentalis TaxID=50954 RepID=UPI0018902A26|nr:SUN domain-containing protein 3 isoform X3 [Talpa occidentalis]
MSGRPKSRRRARYFRGRAEEGSSSASMNVIHPEPRNPDFRGLTRSWKTILSVVCTLTFLLIGLRNHTQLKETEFPQNTRHFYALIADYASRLYNYQIKLRTPKVQLELLKKESQTLEKNFQEILVLIEQIDVLKALLRDMRNSLSNYSWETGGEPTEDEDHMGVEDEEMSNLVDYVLKVFREDQVQMADYALKSAGASIIEAETSESYKNNKAKLFWHGIGFLNYEMPPDIILQGILKQCEGEEIFLGQFIYNKKGITVQTFTIQHEVSESLVCVKLKILSNWGHPKYTCLYRFRVHGTPGDHT